MMQAVIDQFPGLTEKLLPFLIEMSVRTFWTAGLDLDEELRAYNQERVDALVSSGFAYKVEETSGPNKFLYHLTSRGHSVIGAINERRAQMRRQRKQLESERKFKQWMADRRTAMEKGCRIASSRRGPFQESVLASLREHKTWVIENPSWFLNTVNKTAFAMRLLERDGFVSYRQSPGRSKTTYFLTDLGDLELDIIDYRRRMGFDK